MTPPTLNVRCDYFRHPKTQRLIVLLGRGAEVLPMRLWAYCGEFCCEHGRFDGYTEDEIEAIANWWGEKGKALEGLSKVGYLECKKGVWRIVNWREHQGHISALKAHGRRMAEKRWSQYRRGKRGGAGRDADSNAGSNAKGGVQQCHSQPTYLPTDPTYRPKGSGGRGAARSGKASGGDRTANGFPLPSFTELPRPLFADKAKAFLEDCELTIAEIRKSGQADQGKRDALGQVVMTLLPEAREAIKAWQRRMGEIRQARAG